MVTKRLLQDVKIQSSILPLLRLDPVRNDQNYLVPALATDVLTEHWPDDPDVIALKASTERQLVLQLPALYSNP